MKPGRERRIRRGPWQPRAGSRPADDVPTSREPQLLRQLRARHIQLIAIGGTSGVGLFLGSGRAIQMAGPGLLVDYAVAGIAIFFIMRALGELLIYRPVAGSFTGFAEEFIGPFAGYATAWSYWFLWVVVAMAELTAIGVYVHYWAPQIPQWATAFSMLLCRSLSLSDSRGGDVGFRLGDARRLVCGSRLVWTADTRLQASEGCVSRHSLRVRRCRVIGERPGSALGSGRAGRRRFVAG